MNRLLSLEKLTARRGECPVVDSVSLTVEAGECVGLIGPNGAGKTSLMRAALGLLPAEGRSSLASLGAAQRARAVAWLPQARDIAWPMTVETVVALGRIPYLAQGSKLRPDDRAAVDAALAETGLSGFAQRLATQLSGGEQARVLLARALAQETPLLLVDEPTAGLDPAHQIAAMQSFARLAGRGKSVIVSLHDLGLAARHCTRILMLSQGRLVADGPPTEVLTPALLREVFGIRVYYEDTPQGPVFQPTEISSG
ncbi:ABC transporter ATP-binding protein [uncultured Lentibacter sp.]|jgi:iron complex transport system ATP-binding protein|uniref:ABC transporter ATP-binding protein n=1 Tax=uncultured Lentibacter sp. TaxID=1659309 RepID=UPI002626A0A3|nr:ABC transporter ATP-binding protein [uncultured Lentibacter sp.]